jgi:hypothetical protein
MTATSARATLSPAAALARHDHRYWHARYREHLLLSAVALCGCQDGGQLCPDGQRFNDEADAAGKRWERAGKEGQLHRADRGLEWRHGTPRRRRPPRSFYPLTTRQARPGLNGSDLREDRADERPDDPRCRTA